MVTYKYFCSQWTINIKNKKDEDLAECGCGGACLMMLLKNYKMNNLPTIDQLCYDLKLHVPTKEKNIDPLCREEYEKGLEGEDIFGVYLEDIKNYLGKRIPYKSTPFRGRGFFQVLNDDLKMVLNSNPVMVQVGGTKFGRFGHWIVLIAFKDGKYIYCDPEKSSCLKKLSFDELNEYWDGTSLYIEGKNAKKRSVKDL